MVQARARELGVELPARLCGQQLMTDTEQERFREQLRAATTEQERQRLQDQHRAAMQQRAREHQIPVDELEAD